MTVAFLNRMRKYGAKSVVGPVTGINYLITPDGTPVSSLDVDGLLALTEPPCCGEPLPFDGEIRSFGGHVPTPQQLELVPTGLWDAVPLKAPAKKSSRRKKLYEEYDKPVQKDELVGMEQEENPADNQESESEEE